MPSDLRIYYEKYLPVVTKQANQERDTAMSILNMNSSLNALNAEWESEWSQAGLSSRLSEQVCVFVTMSRFDTIRIMPVYHTKSVNHAIVISCIPKSSLVGGRGWGECRKELYREALIKRHNYRRAKIVMPVRRAKEMPTASAKCGCDTPPSPTLAPP